MIYRYLILTRHREGVFLGDESRSKLYYVWIHIESLIASKTAQIVGSNVTNSISTATLCSKTSLLQFTQSRNSIEDIHIMNLNLLTSGDMQMGCRNLLAHLSDNSQLCRSDNTACTTNTKHVVLVFTLFVDTHWHTIRLQLASSNFACLKFLYKLFRVADIAS